MEKTPVDEIILEMEEDADEAMSAQNELDNYDVDGYEHNLSHNVYARRMNEMVSKIGWRSGVIFAGTHSRCKNCGDYITIHEIDEKNMDHVTGLLAYHCKNICKHKVSIDLDDLGTKEKEVYRKYVEDTIDRPYGMWKRNVYAGHESHPNFYSKPGVILLTEAKYNEVMNSECVICGVKSHTK